MNILSIDYGKKNIGLAWCDTAIKVVLPFGTVNSMAEIKKLIVDEKIDKIVVGLPLGLKSEENENTERVKKWVAELQTNISLPIELIDERFTSHEADRMGGTASRDEKSAMIILQSYLGSQSMI